MTKPSAVQPDRLLAWMNLLADDNRLRLLRVLEANELTVAELCQVLRRPQSTISRHLKLLADLRWVRAMRQGTTQKYRSDLQSLDPAVVQLWNIARDQTEHWVTARQDALRLERLLHERSVDSETFFAGAASEWDRLRREFYGERFSTAAMLALLPADLVVADLGCGTGHLTAELAPHVRQVIGIDNSPAMLKAARQRTSGIINSEIRKGDLAAIPIESGTCDAAMLVLALSYVTDAAKLLRELFRILKPGGKAVMVDLLPHDREDFRRQTGQITLGFEPHELEQNLIQAGFINVKLTPLTPDPDATGPALFMLTATAGPPSI